MVVQPGSFKLLELQTFQVGADQVTVEKVVSSMTEKTSFL